MSKFAEYYTYSPLAAMRTGRQPPCPISRRHETLPSPQGRHKERRGARHKGK